MIWHWWDWGYAAHHFSRRDHIADGAEHGGPSLYLPAAVYATDDPRFARQIIKYTAAKGNVPGNVFKGLTASQAADMITWLNNPNNPLIQADGKQYLVLSFDMLDLGFWISTFGSWNFLSKEGRGYAISIVPQALSYRLDKGEVVMKGSNINVPAASIDVFSDGQLDHRDYVTPPEYLPDNAAIKAWKEGHGAPPQRTLHVQPRDRRKARHRRPHVQHPYGAAPYLRSRRSALRSLFPAHL